MSPLNLSLEMCLYIYVWTFLREVWVFGSSISFYVIYYNLVCDITFPVMASNQ